MNSPLCLPEEPLGTVPAVPCTEHHPVPYAQNPILHYSCKKELNCKNSKKVKSPVQIGRKWLTLLRYSPS